MLSVLIPVFNANPLALVQALQEELQHSNYVYEILLVDDASTAASTHAALAAIEQLSHCQVWRQQNNQGRTATRQHLAKKAQFEQLLFLDADVLPKYPDFIGRFQKENHNSDLIFGGITYTEQPPGNSKRLRWTYGKVREAKSVEKRRQMPYTSIISGALYIKKECFLATNPNENKGYGMDAIFVKNLHEQATTVTHIDNPVYHLGLEDNNHFLNKTKSGLANLVQLEKTGLVSSSYRPVQATYQNLITYKLIGLFKLVFGVIHPFILRNLNSSQPSLFAFDLYKLYYYSCYKAKA